jgi:hypothetical protein
MLERITLDNLDHYMALDQARGVLSGFENYSGELSGYTPLQLTDGGLGDDTPTHFPQTPPGPTTTPGGHSTRDKVFDLISQGLAIFRDNRTARYYAQTKGDGSGLFLDDSGNLKLSPAMLLIIFGGIFLFFRKPPGHK